MYNIGHGRNCVEIVVTSAISTAISTSFHCCVEHVHELRFFMDGDRIREDDTPETLKLEDGDQIDCMLEQTGGL